jgi:hypothetical protein
MMMRDRKEERNGNGLIDQCVFKCSGRPTRHFGGDGGKPQRRAKTAVTSCHVTEP